MVFFFFFPLIEERHLFLVSWLSFCFYIFKWILFLAIFFPDYSGRKHNLKTKPKLSPTLIYPIKIFAPFGLQKPCENLEQTPATILLKLATPTIWLVSSSKHVSSSSYFFFIGFQLNYSCTWFPKLSWSAALDRMVLYL